MSNIHIITPSACYTQLNIPANNYTKIQKSKPKLGILRNRNGDGNVNVIVAADRRSLFFEINSKRKLQSLEYYKWLAGKLAEEGRLSDFASLVFAMVEAGANVANFVQQLEMEVVCAGFGSQIENGELYLVLETLSSLHRAGCHSFKFVDNNATQLIAKECGKMVEKGNVNECIRVLQILSDCLFPIKDFVEPIFIIQQCIKLKKVSMALRYRSQRAAMSADMYSYRDIIDACGLCGNPEQAIIIFKELLNQKVTPNIFVYNSIMNVNAGNSDYVLQIYKHMLNSGVAADMTTYNILLKIWCIAGKVDWAEHFYREILKRTVAGELKMDVIAYSTMIQVSGRSQMWALAMNVKRDMISAGITPDVVTWTSLIGACANAGLVEKAIQIFDEMVLSGCEPNTQCCNTLLHACVKSCQYARAFQLFNNWKKNGFYEASAEISLNSEKLHSENSSHRMQASIPGVYNGVSKMAQFKPTVITYNILMKTFSLMRKNGVRPDVIAYTTAIKAGVKNKNPEMAFLIFETMKKYRI